MTHESARKRTGLIGWLFERNAGLGLFASVASTILGILILSGGIWIGLHAEDMNAGPRGLLGLFLAGGWSLVIGLKGLSQKGRRSR
jgi:hypothetical protein